MNLIKSAILLLLSTASVSANNESLGRCGGSGSAGEASAIILLQRKCGGAFFQAQYTPLIECQSQEISTCGRRVSDKSFTSQYCGRQDMSFLKSQCTQSFCAITPPVGLCKADKKAKFLRAVVIDKTSPADAGYEAGKKAVQQLWKNRMNSRCRDISGLKRHTDRMKEKKFPLGSDNWKTNARNTSARTGVDQEVKKIKDNCSLPVSPADAGLEAGKKAVQDYWRNAGSDCGNKFALEYRGEEIKERDFPLGSDNWKTNAHNTSARIGVDQEVKKIWNSCNNDEADTVSDASSDTVSDAE